MLKHLNLNVMQKYRENGEKETKRRGWGETLTEKMARASKDCSNN